MNPSAISGPAPLQILIVEDEPKLGQLLVDYLEAAGYATQWLSNGNDVVPLVKTNPPAMILLDLMLPGSSGLSICRDIRQFSDIPIMMVTAKTEEIDRLLGLEIGADDYVCKPFSPRELIARIKAILRRSRKPDDARVVEIDEAARSVRIHSQLLDLTPMEYSLLAAMVRRP